MGEETLDREDLADLVREGIYGDDRMTGRQLEAALGALREMVDAADRREAELLAQVEAGERSARQLYQINEALLAKLKEREQREEATDGLG